MASLLRPSLSDDAPQIVELLSRVFSVSPSSPFLTPAHLRWKYWDPRADWSGARSMVMEKDGRITAHVGLWPVTLRTPDGVRRGVQMIDWASDPRAPGAGVSLLQRLTKEFDFVYSIGGSDITQAILPKFGFETVTTAPMFARPIRPWRKMRHQRPRDARLPLRAARDIMWSMMPARPSLSGWEAVETRAEALVVPGGERDGAFVEYLERCPLARIVGFQILRQGTRQGCFVLSEIGRQARLVGAWLETPDVESWCMVFCLAQDAALRRTGASEFVARGSGDACAAGAGQAGLRIRGRKPVFLFQKRGRANSLSLQFQLGDDDGAFLEAGDGEFLT